MGSEWIILLIFVERESAVRSCGDRANCVAGTHGPQPTGPRKWLLPAACLVPRRPLLVYPVQAEISEQRDKGKAEKDFWRAIEMIRGAATQTL